jgi:hypothetical protein
VLAASSLLKATSAPVPKFAIPGLSTTALFMFDAATLKNVP